MTIESINPANGRKIQSYEEHTDDQVGRALERAARTFREWRTTDFSVRAKHLQKLAALLAKRKRKYAELMTTEMGKPIRQSVAEIEKCILLCAFFAESAERLLAFRKVPAVPDDSFVRHDPLGPLLAVMPWNFPFWQVLRCAVPALMAGDVVLLKHASNVPGCALAIEKAFLESEFPEGALTTLLIRGRTVEKVIHDKRVTGVALTGSEAAGRKVAAMAGSALKKTVMELGGSDPYLVLSDADLPKAAAAAAQSRTINSGQSCVCAKRFLVHQKVKEEFVKLLRQNLASLIMGDPMNEQTDVGPLARLDLQQELQSQVLRSVKAGAKLLLGGKIPPVPGFYYPVTLLSDVPVSAAVAREETFGPVAPVLSADSDDQLLKLANDCRYGLGASIWTRDLSKGKAMAAKIEAGLVFVNGIVKSDPRLPFGGIKCSGYGRELGEEGIREFVNVKSVCVISSPA